VDPRGVDGVDGVDPGEDGRDEGAGQLVDQLAERGIFLRGAADGGEWPDRAGAVVDALDLEDGEVVGHGVIAEVVAEGAFGLAGIGVDPADDGEVGLGDQREAAEGVAGHRDPTAAEGAGEAQLGEAFGQGHDGGHRQGGRAADEDRGPERVASPDRGRVMHADPAVELVVEADLAVGLVIVARELDPVHPEVRLRQAGPVGVLAVDLRQGDEGAAIPGPRLEPGEPAQGRPVLQDRPASDPPRQEVEGGERDVAVPPGPGEGGGRPDLQLDEVADGLEGVAEEEMRPFPRAEQVADHREVGPLDPPEEDRRPPDLVEPALDGRGLQVGGDRLFDRDQSARPPEVLDAVGQRAITHDGPGSRSSGGGSSPVLA